MTNTSSELLEQLKKASDGLLFMSESEAPFEPFYWEAVDKGTINPKSLLQKTGRPQNTPVEVVDLDCFFQVATTEQKWHSPEEHKTVKKFNDLVNTLKQNLSDIKVYRVGKRNIDVYIVGKISAENYAGVSTKVVET
jgi:hypothetical protein